MIFVFRTDGLFARLAHLWQVSYLSEKYKTHLHCIWKPTSQCDLHFKKLFVEQSFFSVYSSVEELKEKLPKYADLEMPYNFFGLYDNEKYISGGNIDLRFDEKIKYYIKMFSLKDNIIIKYNKTKEKYNIDKTTYSFYIRGLECRSFGPRSATTSDKDVENVILKSFKKIEDILSEDKNSRILIASPEIEIEKRFIDAFPKNCFVIKEDQKPTHMLGINNAGRNEKNVIDGFILGLLFSETTYKSCSQQSFFYSFPFYLKRIREIKDFLKNK